MKKRYRERTAKAKALLGGKCVSCGSAEDLQFDHIDPSHKTATVTAIMSYRWSVVEAELEKCQLLCAACHKNKTCVDMKHTYKVDDKWTHTTCARCNKEYKIRRARLDTNTRRGAVNLCSKRCVGLWSTIGTGDVQGCGSVSGYFWCGPPTCRACKDAINAYTRERRRKKKEESARMD